MTIDDWGANGTIARIALYWVLWALCLAGPIYTFVVMAGDDSIIRSEWAKYSVMFAAGPSMLAVYSLASALSAVEPLVVLFIFLLLSGISAFIVAGFQDEGEFRSKLTEIGAGFIGSAVGFFSSWATRNRSLGSSI